MKDGLLKDTMVTMKRTDIDAHASMNALPHFGLNGQEPFLCPIKPQHLVVSKAETPDVHGGDIESAIIHAHYPHLVDGDQADRITQAILGRIMDYQIIPMTTQHAAQISSWQYMNEYSLYSMDNTDACRAELLNGKYHVVVVDGVGEPIGYFCFGKSAQVPAGEQFGVYDSDLYLDMGLGMNPKGCGHGKGYDFMLSGIRFARQQLSAAAFRLTVARFNKRAIIVYARIGFREVGSFTRETANERMEFAVMCLDA